MLAKRTDALPRGSGWIFEPKWDGFRAIVFRSGRDLFLQSRDARPLARYYPELLAPLKSQLPRRCVLDGEIVIARPGGLDFDALQQRLHPSESRVRKLSRETPASMVFFDLLCLGARDLRPVPFGERREVLERSLARAGERLHLTPATRERKVAADWYRRFEGAGLDGVIAKRADGVYEPGKRVMLKIKHERECDCVVAGFRWDKRGQSAGVGSLLLGLYDAHGVLQHVGSCAASSEENRREIARKLARYRSRIRAHPWLDVDEQGEGHRRPGAESRWSRGKDLAWVPLRPELVAEVAYDHMQRARFRHVAQFRRWRPDKPPAECTYEQLEVVPPIELASVFAEV